MITKAIIENFQSHQYTIVDFVKGVNVIIGPSDTGKSAIFRAINWVCSNRPLGDSYRSEWGGDTKVTLFTDDGHTVQRYRTNYENGYLIDDDIRLTAFGNGEPPIEVRDILKLDSFNIQSQSDSPFLLWSTPGEVAQLLNKAASLDDIDTVLSGLRSNLLRINRDITYGTEQQKILESNMARFENLESLRIMIEDIISLEGDYNREMGLVNAFTDLIKRTKRVRDRFNQTIDVTPILKQYQIVAKEQAEYQISKNLHDRHKGLLEEVISLTDELEDSDGVEKALKIVEEASSGYVMWKREQAILSKGIPLVNKTKKMKKDLEDMANFIQQQQSEYDRLSPPTCPLCGGPMKKEA